MPPSDASRAIERLLLDPLARRCSPVSASTRALSMRLGMGEPVDCAMQAIAGEQADETDDPAVGTLV
jgi:hypothetical protein